MASGAGPQDGDVVVCPETRDGHAVFVLRTAPGPGQLVAGTRADALDRALAFARRHGVSVWIAESDDGPVTLIEDSRLRTASSRPVSDHPRTTDGRGRRNA